MKSLAALTSLRAATTCLLFLTTTVHAWSIPTWARLMTVEDVQAEEEALRIEEARKEAEKTERLAFENARKYFHEPASHEVGADDLLGHYDTRFFKGQLDYGDKRDAQVHMVRAYLDTFREKGVETWIAHGTLLGWWWNANVSFARRYHAFRRNGVGVST